MLDTTLLNRTTRRRSALGQGLSFAPRVDADGRLAWSYGEDNVRESIRILLLTEPGERLMREGFGAGLRRFLFEPNTVTNRQLISEQIDQAIARWEPRVVVQDILVEADLDEPRRANITIAYRLVATQAVATLSMSLLLEG